MNRFHYQSFHIEKSQTLGHGSYGAVYKAKCDQLPCAAKLLHATILDPMDPGADKIMQRFQQECTLLESIRHPNIVQYLGITMDPDSRLPVLLMELLDESLTKMLERSQQPLPYDVQVDICHDIALAVAYLHSNDIIHRDLSSNNVLMIAGRRAKVTDFGMSRLTNVIPSSATLTKCPGTPAYMSPEALREPPRYTKKLDNFSEGVIMIQVCTRLWPEPGPRTQLVPDSRSPTGSTEMPILEQERRKSHIDLINQTHPLLSIAIDCLHHEESTRLSSEEICEQLAALKDAREYRESVQKLSRDNAMYEDGKQVEDKHALGFQEIQQLKEEIKIKENELEEKVRELRQKDRIHTRVLRQKDAQILAKNNDIVVKARQIRRLNQQVDDQVQFIGELQQTNQSLQSQVVQLEIQLNRLLPKTKSSQGSSKQESHSPQPLLLKWRNGRRAPIFEMAKGDSVVKGNVAYFMSYSGAICSYNTTTRMWNELATCPYKCSSLVIIGSNLVSVGGFCYQFDCTNKLMMLDTGKWVEQFCSMPTKRYNTAAVTTEQHLIVAGGKTEAKSCLATVEVMDIATQRWSKVANLPLPYSDASATVCGDHLYLLGGRQDDKEVPLVLVGSLSSIVQGSRLAWQKVADTAAICSTGAAIGEEMFAVGGFCQRDRNTIKVVSRYDALTNSWNPIGNMPTARYDCLVVVLPNDEVIVVGGREHYGASNKVEIGVCA